MAEDRGKWSDEELRGLIQDDIDREVAENRNRLVGIEEDILDELGRKSSAPFTSVFRKLSYPRLSLAGAAVGLIVIGLVMGLFLGNYLESPSLNTKGETTFVVAYPEANQVALAGDFNNWQPQALHKREGGLWAIRLDLQPGRYEYNFIVDGQRWVPDPRASEYARSYGQLSSVIYVGTKKRIGSKI